MSSQRTITGGVAVAAALVALLATGTARSQEAITTEVLVRSMMAGDGAHTFEVLGSRLTRPAPPASRGRIEHAFVAEAIDARGRVLDARGFNDPHEVRAEWPDATGLLHGRRTSTPSTTFRLAFSTDAAIDSIRFSLRAAGSLVPLGSASVTGGQEDLGEETTPEISVIRDNGPAANRVDLVIVAEGYTEAERAKFSNDVEWFLNDMFGEQPFHNYRRYFNVRGLFVASAESGADHPERLPPVYRDTAFHATYNCSNIQRLICVHMQTVQIALWTTLDSIESDVVLVLVNDEEYGGSGGTIAVSSVNTSASEIVLHELGHSYGLLADEYTDQPPTCSLIGEPAAANATRELIRERIKWRHWIDQATPVPTLESQPNSTPGVYLGADYCPVGKWRPTQQSKMRALGFPFEPINSEQLVRRTYALVSPIDATAPQPGSLTLGPADAETFTVTTTAPVSPTIEVAWFIDGILVGSGPSYVVEAAALAAGEHELLARATDRTSFVRHDPTGLLQDSVTWSITVS